MKKTFRILCVDNSRLFHIVINEISARNGLITDSCTTAQKALTKLEEQDYDLICASYHLSDMSGDLLCQQIREIPKYLHTKIILFSAEENKNLLKKVLLAGATDIFSKDNILEFETYLQRLSESFFNTNVGQILLIEDSPSQLQWIEALLIEDGWEVESFSNAEDAIVSFVENEYDLVVTDIVLDGAMSGISLVREIRRDLTDKGTIPIFSISAYDEASRRIGLYHVGINDYMTKPIIAEEFIFRVRSLIQSHRVFNELNKERMHLKSIALLDPLTGLYNRNAFNEFTPIELEKAKRLQTPMSLAILDIDHFKQVNDRFGHAVGDQVLAEVGLLLRNTLRKGDMVFRWGGEEFVILLTSCPTDKAKEVLEKQRIRFNNRKYADITITASIGISGVNVVDKEVSIQQLFKEADKAVYIAKESGRNKVCLFK